MVHEAMVLEYSGRHLALIELAAVAEAAALHLADRLHLRAVGPGRRRAPASRAYAIGVAAYLGKLAVGGFLLALFETVDRQDARVPRAGLPRRGADARPARHAAALRVAEPLMQRSRLRRRPPARRRPGAGQLHAALPGPLFALLNVFALHALVLALSVAWQAYIQDAPHLYVTAAIALVFKAIVIPVALHRIDRAARHPPRDRDRWSASA